jgi:hypothetical protein
VVTFVVLLATPRNEADDELRGLVCRVPPRVKEHGMPWFKQPALLGCLVLAPRPSCRM